MILLPEWSVICIIEGNALRWCGTLYENKHIASASICLVYLRAYGACGLKYTMHYDIHSSM